MCKTMVEWEDEDLEIANKIAVWFAPTQKIVMASTYRQTTQEASTIEDVNRWQEQGVTMGPGRGRPW